MINSEIKYYSTNRKAPEVSFREALLKGLAPDGGLYMPVSIPVFKKEELESFSLKKYSEIAFLVLNKFTGDEIDSQDLQNICNDAYNFDVPLERVFKRNYILRLDQGPTASFKDFAARIMSRLMQYYLARKNQHLTILTATSGDTGSAVANAFYGLKNIDVVILFPVGEVSVMQRKQMTTLNKNISIIAVEGKFDDCQRMVKKAFTDPSLSHIELSSANSINIGRLIPQSVYYFYAWARLASGSMEKATFSVPSGNFGNLMGGLIARKMGLPVYKFIISTNSNNEVPEYIRSGVYKSIVPSVNCISSAMNVGHPSNLPRIVSLYNGIMDELGKVIKSPDMKQIQHDMFGVFVSDDNTIAIIDEVYRKYNILLEPHGAVAWYGLKEFLKDNRGIKSGRQLCISLETAHPAKFPAELHKILKTDPPLPASLSGIMEKSEQYFTIGNDYQLLNEYIIRAHK